MLRILDLNNGARQKMTLTLYNGESADIEIYYQPQQQGWFITELSYGDTFVLRGVRITNNPNFLRQYKNFIPFGLACFSDDGRDPMLQQDFSSGHNRLFVLSEAEVLEYEEYLSSGQAES